MTYLLFSVLIFNLMVYMVPKRISKQEIYAVVMFSLLFGLLTDITLDLKFNLYGYFETGLQLKALIAIAGLFPAAGVLFMNFYPRERPLWYKTLYILLCTVLSLFYEWTALLSDFFYHNEWTLWYSAMVYPLALLLQLLNLRFFQYLRIRD